MLFSEISFIGIDPSAGVKPFYYAAIDQDRDLLALGQGQIDDVLAFAGGQSQAVVAVCAPRRPNTGLMANEAFRQTLSPPPQPGKWIDFRYADYQLWQHNIRIPQTRKREQDCPKWIQMGFSLYRRLENFGYKTFPSDKEQCQLVEVYPHASYAVLLGILPFHKHTLEGRLQRQLVLLENDLKVPDPMKYLKRITRTAVKNGAMPPGGLYAPEELDALIAAYTAWAANFRPEQITFLGDMEEGQIVIPSKQLKGKYL